LLTVIGLLRFTKDNDTLFLLDEPDTHLNPQWSYDYKEMLEEVMKEARGCQIIMATHDPVLIAGLTKENVRLMERRDKAEDPNESEGSIETRQPNEDPLGQSVGRILEGEIFDLASAVSSETRRDLERQRELAFKSDLEQGEEDELRRLVRKLRNIDLTQVIEDPLYTHFVEAVMKHPDYPRLKDAVRGEAISPILKRISEEVRDDMLRKAEGEEQ
jgi:ABC-type glutathione transport system ATPase component